jgi:hypothetical protein
VARIREQAEHVEHHLGGYFTRGVATMAMIVFVAMMGGFLWRCVWVIGGREEPSSVGSKGEVHVSCCLLAAGGCRDVAAFGNAGHPALLAPSYPGQENPNFNTGALRLEI